MDRNTVERKLLVLFIKNIGREFDESIFGVDMETFGLNSWIFIKLLCDIETEFSIKFENERIQMKNYKNLADVVDSVMEMLS